MSSSIFDLQGKTAVVVGGTTGIGHALALGLADAGADVVASSRRPEQVEQTAAQIEAKGRKTLRHTSDVHDRATLEALRDAVLGAFGKVDILINCAGITKRAPTHRLSRSGLGPDHRHQSDRHAAGLPGLRQTHAQPRLRTHHQYCLALHLRGTF